MSRWSNRELWVGLVVVVAIMGLFGLMVLAGGGPAYLSASRTSVEVVFRDAQGIRSGHPVRVAGLEAGRVSAVDLTEYEGQFRARIRLSIPADLAQRLKQDAVIVVQSSLTGQPCVNIASMGESDVTLVPGQPVEGVESSMFDPILEQVGLGPVERGHISHTIAQLRGAVDQTVPRFQKILASLQQAAVDIEHTTEAVRPAVANSAAHLEEIVPQLQTILVDADQVLGELNGLLEENRPNLRETLAHLNVVTEGTKHLIAESGPKVAPILDGIDETRKRAEMVLIRGDNIALQTEEILTQNRADIERTLANVRDATDFARMLVQKIYANPFLLSPLYKPNQDDKVALANFDTAQEFLKGASEFNDAVKKLDAMRNKPISPGEEQALNALFRQMQETYNEFQKIQRRLADSIQSEPLPQSGGLFRGARPVSGP